MKRIFRLSVGISTFICGCVLSWLHLAYTRQPAVTASPAPNVEIQQTRQSLLEGIKPVGRGCGNGYSQVYELPEGKKLGEGNSCFSSFKEAKSQMQEWLRASAAIIDRGSPPKNGQT